MKRFSLRAFAYVLVVLLGLLSAAPNILPANLASKLPDWYTHNVLALGLDLQGGSHLLLQADTDELYQRHFDDAYKNWLSALRKAHIRYRTDTSYHGAANTARISIVQPEQADKARFLASQISQNSQGIAALDVNTSDDQLTASLSATYQQALLKDAIDRSLEVVRKRLNETGLTEPSITRQGDDAVLVQMPGVSDPSHIKNLLGTTAKMSFHWQAKADQLSHTFMLKDNHGNAMRLEQQIALEGEHIVDAQASYSQQTGQPIVTFRLDNSGAAQFADMTRDNIGRALAVVLDGKIVTAPVIQSVIPGGRGEITGQFTPTETRDTALMLRTGALPVPLSVIEERTVGPDQGSDAIKMGITTGIAGALLVLGFMATLYGRWGLIACVGLSINIGLVFGLLSLFGATLTLPGIAGIILTIGMAVDANILINERIREESLKGRPAGGALKAGFDKAYATILDSNLTTLIAVSLLFMFGSGPIKGFAVTIAIGLLTSMFTAVAVTRMMMQWAIAGKERQALTFGAQKFATWWQNRQFNFMGARLRALVISVVLTLSSIGLFCYPGLHYGVDFTGGTMIEVNSPGVDASAMRTALGNTGHSDVNIQQYGDGNHFLLRAAEGQQGANAMQNLESLKQALRAANPDVEFLKVDAVGPKVSGDFADLSTLALLIAGAGMLVYLWFRFERHFALAAILTIILDLTKTIGFFALTGIEFNLTAVAALLALIGYSVNDKVVVFDRIRELFRLNPEADVTLTINQAINATLTRTLFTSLTTLLALLPMGIAGGDAVASFALPMIFAVIAGTSSTLFIAANILGYLADRRERQGIAQLRPTSQEIKASLADIP